MIPKAAVKEYLTRKRDSHLWVKKLSKVTLWQAVNELRPRPKLYDGLRAHQLACFLLGVAFPRFAFWLDMGTGKTLLSLMLLQYWWDCKKLRRAVIFITSDKAFYTWEKQIKRYGVRMPYTFLDGSSVDKFKQLDEFGDGLIFVTYPGAVAMATVAREFKKGERRKGKKKSKIDPTRLARLADGVGALVLDESTRASGHRSLTFALVDKLKTDVRYALAGRPFGRDPTLLWAQHYLVDRGETLGDTLGMFREALFTESENEHVHWSKRGFVKQYTFDKRKESVLARMIQHRSITYSAEECIDVPKFQSIIEEVRFAKEAQSYYDRAVDTIIQSKGNMRAVKNVFLRMRQLSSGFLGFKDDDTGEKAQVEFDENPKFDRLMEFLDEVPLDRKAVVFYEFTHSGRKISDAVAAELDMDAVWLWSGTVEPMKALRKFEEDPDCRLAVLNNKVGAYSLDGLQVANYAFFYESPVSPIDREQAERRLRRDGQLFKVLQWDLIVKGSMDQRILDFHAEGEDLMKALLRDPSMLLTGKRKPKV